ncbi:hypothetical protein DFS34DRAFT_649245 [Phlyctochytrium arcticum]|nr:hypothetical protein DFS34DRAFT_649245 [Phlyctochytrium arcticum]
MDPRTIVFTDFDEATSIGTAYILSSLNTETSRRHRHVAVYPAPPLPEQVQQQIQVEPADFFNEQNVYINFAFKVKCRVHLPIPAPRIPKDTYPPGVYDPAPYPVKFTRNAGRMPAASLKRLEDLHVWFWTQRRHGIAPPGVKGAGGDDFGSGGGPTQPRGASSEGGDDGTNPGPEGSGREGTKETTRGGGGERDGTLGAGAKHQLRVITWPVLAGCWSSFPYVPTDAEILRALESDERNRGGIGSRKYRKALGYAEPQSASEDEEDTDSDSDSSAGNTMEDRGREEVEDVVRLGGSSRTPRRRSV